MFQSSTNRVRAWLSRLDDLLAEHPDETRAGESDFRTHPHRQALRWDRPGRPGTVAARPAHCISPVRAPHDTNAARTSAR